MNTRYFTDERGVATAMAMIVMALLLTMGLAFLAVSAFEPQISRNHADTVRARYAAEAGVEAAFNKIVATLDLNTLLVGAGACNATNHGVLMTSSAYLPGTPTWPALPAGGGTYTVRVRNDCDNNDNLITGVPVEGANTEPANGNKILILESTGTVNGATRTIQVAVKRNLLVFPGAVNMPGTQADTFINNANFDIDGRDYGCSSNCDNRANWAVTSNPLKWGIATQTGTQQNIAPTTYEERVESGFNDASKQANVKGKNETNPNGAWNGTQTCSGGNACTTGLNTIEADASLNPNLMHDFLNLLANQPSTKILQSTMACPMHLTGTADPHSPRLTNGCGTDQPLYLGTRSDPQLIYFRGELDTSSNFPGLTLNSGGTLKGAGILVIEDGDLQNYANVEWDGVVIVTGRYVGAGFRSGSTTNIYGAFVSLEDISNEQCCYYEFLVDATMARFRASKQNMDMVSLLRPLHVLYGWREL